MKAVTYYRVYKPGDPLHGARVELVGRNRRDGKLRVKVLLAHGPYERNSIVTVAAYDLRRLELG